MPVTCSPQYGETVLAQVRVGRSVYDLTAQLELIAATFFRWKNHDQIDVGAMAGLSSQDSLVHSLGTVGDCSLSGQSSVLVAV